MTDAQAIRMQAYGGPEVLQLGPLVMAPLQPHEVRLRMIAAAVNHTDLKIRAGLWPIRRADPFPYTPGVELVGEILETGAEVQGLRPGMRVITMMQGLGGVRAERPGAYAQEVTVAADAVAVISADPLTMAGLGLAAVTALSGLARLGDLSGRDLIVTGAAGGVGLAAVALGRLLGARVTGVLSSPARAGLVEDQGARVVLAGQALPPADAVLDTVGAALFAPCLAALRPGGALSLVGAVGGSAVPLDLWELIRPLTLTGYSSETLDGPALRAAVARLETWVAAGALALPAPILMPLFDAARAHAGLETGALRGRVLLLP